jgi:hypothetical protein
LFGGVLWQPWTQGRDDEPREAIYGRPVEGQYEPAPKQLAKELLDMNDQKPTEKKTMETLDTFFRKLAKYERTPATELVSPWRESDVDSILKAFESARGQSRIQFGVENTLSVQAMGNRVEHAVAAGLQRRLGKYELLPCSGQGYPDRRLERRKDGRSFAFEVKAKPELDPTDTQRIILTTGTRKLRRNFNTREPICHLLVTAVYSTVRQGNCRRVLVQALDFDFLEPWTLVQNQYQASVNQRLLARGEHSRRLLMWSSRGRHKQPKSLFRDQRVENNLIVLS